MPYTDRDARIESMVTYRLVHCLFDYSCLSPLNLSRDHDVHEGFFSREGTVFEINNCGIVLSTFLIISTTHLRAIEPARTGTAYPHDIYQPRRVHTIYRLR